MEKSTFRLKAGLAEMLKGGVIMDVVTAEQAKIAEDAGAVAVMALERVPADIRAHGGVARMSDRDPALLRYLGEMGIRPGVTLRLVDRAPFEGPLTVAVGPARHVIGAAVARKVYVR